MNPKVIDVPSSAMARSTIDAIAGDGIQLKVKARVTVRINIDRLVGGATEETVVARVGQGIVTTIGSAENHMAVLESPDRISKVVLAEAEVPLAMAEAFRSGNLGVMDHYNMQNIMADTGTRRSMATPDEPAQPTE